MALRTRSATIKALLLANGSLSAPSTAYAPDDRASVLGCTEQWQWRNQGSPKACTPLYGRQSADNFDGALNALNLNPRQASTLERVLQASDTTPLNSLIQYLGSSNLLATQCYDGLSLPLPSDQWVSELDHWYGTAMVTLQLNFLRYVTGDGDPSHNKYQIPPSKPGVERTCTNQIVQRDDFASFSMPGFCCILIIEGLLDRPRSSAARVVVLPRKALGTER